MNSRERLLSALSHSQPDRVPRNFWAEPPTWNRIFDFVGHTDKEKILTQLDIDIRILDVPGPVDMELGGGVYRNFWGEQFTYRQTDWGPMREDIHGALHQAETFADLEAFDWPSPDQFDYTALPQQVKRFSECGLLYGFADIWERPALLRGLENMFIDMCERPDWVHFLARKFTDFYIEDYTRAAETTNGRIDMFLLISDLGSQKGPLISKKMFREFIAPYIREMCDCIHGLGAKVLYHSCGSIRTFISELIECGIDVLDPIQPLPGMEPELLKAEFGDRLAFHGGIDIQKILPLGTPQEVQRESHKYGEILGNGGGYILCPAHLFQPDIPPENVFAMYNLY